MPTNSDYDGYFNGIGTVPLFTYGMMAVTTIVLGYITWMDTGLSDSDSESETPPSLIPENPATIIPESPTDLVLPTELQQPVSEEVPPQSEVVEPEISQSEPANPSQEPEFEELPTQSEELPTQPEEVVAENKPTLGGKKRKTKRRRPSL